MTALSAHCANRQPVQVADPPPAKHPFGADVALEQFSGRTKSTWSCWVWFFLIAAAALCDTAYGQTETIRVDLKLRTGGALSGPVVDQTDHGLVIVHETVPYVFAWGELESGCAYRTRRSLLVFQRGGEQQLTPEDYFQLGVFMLAQDRNDLASREFRQARRLDRAYGPLIDEAIDEYRRRQERWGVERAVTIDGSGLAERATDDSRLPGMAERIPDKIADPQSVTIASGPLGDRQSQVLQVYKTFGEKVQDVLGNRIVLVETDHFLIWTDWEERHRDKLAGWCEAMYRALCAHFHLDPGDKVFLAKCPVFCWRSAARFKKFARLFDGYDGANAIGYTRSIQRNGHVHVVLLRQGHKGRDFDRFACTLVHEVTHAFLHRLYSTRLIPHWVNEGYADMIAEHVLGDRCPTGENAELLARQFVRYGWPIGELLRSTGPIEVHQYPIAQSVVAFLAQQNDGSLVGFIKDLKAGASVPAALAAHYDKMTLGGLETRWRSAIQAGDSAWHDLQEESAVLPWANE